MITAFLLLVTRGGKETIIAEKLLKEKIVLESHIVYGEYDIIAKVKARNMKELQEFVISLRKNKNIERTITMVGVE